MGRFADGHTSLWSRSNGPALRLRIRNLLTEIGRPARFSSWFRAGPLKLSKWPFQKELSDFSHLWLVVSASYDGATRCRGLKSPPASIDAMG